MNCYIDFFENKDFIINLTGENIFGIWTKDKKQKIFDSRIQTTKKLVEIINQLSNKPKILFQASAIGIYGDRKDEILNEDSSPGGDFLSYV